MKTSQLCRKPAVTAAANMSLIEVSRLMRKEHVGSVVILDAPAAKPIGIVTDRDIVMEVVAPGLDAKSLTAGDIMTTSPAVARDDDDILWVLKIMRDRGVRRLPVLGEGDRLTGVISFDDLMQHVSSTLSDIAQVIGTERSVESWRRAS